MNSHSGLVLGIAAGILSVAVPYAGASLSVTNGNFSLGASGDSDVPEWYEYDNGGNFWENPWVHFGGDNPFESQCAAFSAMAGDATVNGNRNNSYMYQAIGAADGAAAITVSFDWGNFTDNGNTAGRNLGLTVQILESDGTFVPAEEKDVQGGAGVTLVGQQSLQMLNAADGQTRAEVMTFDLSGVVSSTNTLYLRFNNYDPAGTDSEWLALDNVVVETAASLPPFQAISVVTPADGASGVMSPVVLSADVVDWGSTFDSGQIYLDGFESEIASSATTLSGTTTVSTAAAPLTLAANSTHTAYLVATAASGESVTNEWTFTMSKRFSIALFPADQGYALDYGFQPTIRAQIIDLNDTLEYVDLYTNGIFTGSSGIGGSGTTLVSVVCSPLQPGEVVSNSIIAYGPGGDPITNEWSFTMGGGAGITIWTTNNPTPGVADIAQFEESETDVLNLDSGDNESTFLAGDTPAQGQTFTTPSGNGFELTSVWLKNVAYTTECGLNAGDTLVIRITDPAQTNTSAFVKRQETLTVLNDNISVADADGSGRWIECRLATPVILNAGKTYGFDVANPSGSGWTEISAVTTDPYAEGGAYFSGDNGVGLNTVSVDPLGDRTFMVVLSETGEPFSLDSVSPMGSGIMNPPLFEVVVSELNSTFEAAQLFLDGEELLGVNISGMNPYTISCDLMELAPLSTHTGKVVMTGVSPMVSVTNEWTFTMGDSFTFGIQEPASGVMLVTNETPVSLQVINGVDYYSSAVLLLDGEDAGATITRNGVTNTLILATSGALEPGEHSVSVIVSGVLFGDVTNSWGFTVIANGTASLSAETPWVGDGVQNLNFSTNAASNTQHPYVANNYIGLRTDGLHAGQSFTTGSNPAGYTLSSVSVRQVSWGATGWDYTGGNVSLRVLSLSGDAGGVLTGVDLREESAAIGGADGGYTNGVPGEAIWLTFELSSPVTLAPDSLYGFVFSSDGNAANDGFLMEWDGTGTNSYDGGGSLTVPPGGLDPWSGGTPSDRAFVATMTALGPVDGPEINVSFNAGESVLIAWPTSYGNGYTVLTNDNLVTGIWGDAGMVPYDNGSGNYEVTNRIGAEPVLFYKLESR